ncbi:MAG TPA: hypothetical protein VF080_18675 [Solirubrobacteraceae bacterium]
MPQSSPEPPVARRLRLVRRRIAAGTLATFIAAWLAVAALGKGGSTSSAATSPAPTTGAPSQSDDGFGPPQSGEDSGGDGFGPPQGGDGTSSGADSGSSQSSGGQGGPVTTGQS